MTGERPKRGLGGLGAIRDMAQQADPAPQAAPEALPAPAPAPAARRPPRGTFSTRLLPDLHHFLKRQVLDLGWSLGKPVSMEDVLEAIMTEYQQDEALRERVRQRVDEG